VASTESSCDIEHRRPAMAQLFQRSLSQLF